MCLKGNGEIPVENKTPSGKQLVDLGFMPNTTTGLRPRGLLVARPPSGPVSR